MKRQIYLDNSATTEISEEALNKYIEVSRGAWGNPSSLHSFGLSAEREINAARDILLSTLGASSDAEIIFTSSGSEANNLAILGRAMAKDRYKRGAKIVTSLGEHASVTEPIKRAEVLGLKVAKIPTKDGKLDTGALLSELTGDVVLVSIMMVNNETGALYDVGEVAKMMKARCPEAYLHVDATQSYMKVAFTKKSIGADMITLSSHKIAGPKGVGALVIDKRVIKEKGLSPIVLGGGQELGLRSGTENVPGIAAFGEAARLAHASRCENIEKMEALRSYLISRLSEDAAFSDILITNPPSHAPHILNITLPAIKSETMLHYLSAEGVFVSSGSACSSNSREVSSALVAYGRSEAEADSSIRISFSPKNTEEDVDEFLSALSSGLSRLARIRR